MSVIVIVFLLGLVVIVALLVYFLVIKKKDNPTPNPTPDPTVTVPNFTFPNEFKTKVMSNNWDTSKTLSKKYIFLSFNKDSGTINNKTINGINNYIETDFFTGIGKIYTFDDTFPTDTFEAITIGTEENVTLTNNTDGWMVSMTNPINKYFIGLPVVRTKSNDIFWNSTLQEFTDPKSGDTLPNEYAICYYSDSLSLWLNHGIRIDKYKIVLFNPLHDNKIKTNDITPYNSYYNLNNNNWVPNPDRLNSLMSTNTWEDFTYANYFSIFEDVDLYDPSKYVHNDHPLNVVHQITNQVLSGRYNLNDRSLTIEGFAIEDVPWFYSSDNFQLDPSTYIQLEDIVNSNLTNTNGAISGNVPSFRLSLLVPNKHSSLNSIGQIQGNVITIDRDIYKLTECSFNDIKSFNITDKKYVFTFNDKINLYGKYSINLNYSVIVGSNNQISYKIGPNTVPVNFRGDEYGITGITFNKSSGDGWSMTDQPEITNFTKTTNLNISFTKSNVTTIILNYSDNFRSSMQTDPLACTSNIDYSIGLGTVVDNNYYYYYDIGIVTIPFVITGQYSGVSTITFPKQNEKDNKYEITSDQIKNMGSPFNVNVNIKEDINNIILKYYDDLDPSPQHTIECNLYKAYTISLGNKNVIYCINGDNSVPVHINNTPPPIADFQFSQYTGTGWSIAKQPIDAKSNIVINLTSNPNTPVDIHYNDKISGDQMISNCQLKYINHIIHLGTNDVYQALNVNQKYDVPFHSSGYTDNVSGFKFLKTNDDNCDVDEQPKTFPDSTVSISFKKLPINGFTLQYYDDNLDDKIKGTTIPCYIQNESGDFDINLGYLLNNKYYYYYTIAALDIPFKLTIPPKITNIDFIGNTTDQSYSITAQTKKVDTTVNVTILKNLSTLSLTYKDHNDPTKNKTTGICNMVPMYSITVGNNNNLTYAKGNINVPFHAKGIPEDEFTFIQQSGTNWSIIQDYKTSPMVINFTGEVASPLNLKYVNKLTGKQYSIDVALTYVSCDVHLGDKDTYNTPINLKVNLPISLTNKNNFTSITFLYHDDDDYTIPEQPKTFDDIRFVVITFYKIPTSPFTLKYRLDTIDSDLSTKECNVKQYTDDFDIYLGYLSNNVYYDYYTMGPIDIPFQLKPSNINYISFLQDTSSSTYFVNPQSAYKDTSVKVNILKDLSTLSLTYRDPNDFTNSKKTKVCNMYRPNITIGNKNSITYSIGDISVPFTIVDAIPDDVLTFIEQDGTNWSIAKEYTNGPMVINFAGDVGSPRLNLIYKSQLTQKQYTINVELYYVDCQVSLGVYGRCEIQTKQAINIPFTLSNKNIKSITFLYHSDDTYQMTEQTLSSDNKYISGITFSRVPTNFQLEYTFDGFTIMKTILCKISIGYGITIGFPPEQNEYGSFYPHNTQGSYSVYGNYSDVALEFDKFSDTLERINISSQPVTDKVSINFKGVYDYDPSYIESTRVECPYHDNLGNSYHTYSSYFIYSAYTASIGDSADVVLSKYYMNIGEEFQLFLTFWGKSGAYTMTPVDNDVYKLELADGKYYLTFKQSPTDLISFPYVVTGDTFNRTFHTQPCLFKPYDFSVQTYIPTRIVVYYPNEMSVSMSCYIDKPENVRMYSQLVIDEVTTIDYHIRPLVVTHENFGKSFDVHIDFYNKSSPRIYLSYWITDKSAPRGSMIFYSNYSG